MNRRTFIKGSSLSALGALSVASAAPSFGSTFPDDKTDQVAAVKSVEELVTRKTREAIRLGLKYLANKQVGNGRTKGAFGQGGYAGGVAVTALGGLAFLCSGSTPAAGPYASHIRACTDYILKNVRESGYISENDATRKYSNMYGHGYAMLYLTQVAGMSKRSDLREKLEKAVKMTCGIQNNVGGWRYQPVKRDADLSITICQIMALRAAHNSGFEVSNEVREKTVGYIESCQNPDGSFHYTEKGGRTTLALTGAGVVSYYSAGIYDGPKVEKALKWIYDHRPGRASGQIVSPMNYYYAHYYAVQAMWHAQLLKPSYWNNWYPLIRDELIDDKRNRDGTWPDRRVGPEFATAMSCIILQMPFNYVPVFSP
jgi:prenyltransferase beta subunit